MESEKKDETEIKNLRNVIESFSLSLLLQLNLMIFNYRFRIEIKSGGGHRTETTDGGETGRKSADFMQSR